MQWKDKLKIKEGVEVWSTENSCLLLKRKMQLTFIDLFAGVGGFRKGMELAGHKCIGFCEWDKFATMSYTNMHLATDEQREYLLSLPLKDRQKEIIKEEYRNGEWYASDISTVDANSMPKADIWTFGAPCQDFSIAGERRGLDGDRSSLVREVFRLVKDTKEEDRPQYLIYENVKGMLSSNNGWDFACILTEMESLGYDIEYQLFNSKNFGVPQNRERVYVVGHLRGRGGRKIFPITEANGITGNEIKRLAHSKYFRRVLQTYDVSGSCEALDTMQGGNRQPCVAIPVLTPDRIHKRQNGRRFKENGEDMFTLTAQDRHGVMVREATKQGFAVAEIGDSINPEQPNSKTRRGRVGKNVAQTLTTGCNQGTISDLRIRKLTPKECFRLQGWEDAYFNRAAMVNSDSQLYKQAGNGVTVTVVQAIAERVGGKIEQSRIRRQQRTSTKGKATYILTKQQIEDMKQEIYEKASKQALILMLAIPCEVLANDYWTKTAKQRLPEFVEKCLSLFSSFEKGVVTLEEMNEDLWELAGYKIEK